tara:strand:+ start:666 stop:1214 length:549 start_codon:yes stop_codon:yes gene_type:complete
MDRFKKNTGFSVSSPFRRKTNPFGITPVFGERPKVFGGNPYGRKYQARDANDPLGQAQAYVLNQRQAMKQSMYFRNQDLSDAEIYKRGYQRYQKQLNEYLNKPLSGGFGFSRLQGDRLRKYRERVLDQSSNNSLDRLRSLRNVYKDTHKEIKMTGKSTLGDLSDRPMLPPSMLTYKRKRYEK